MVHLQESGSEFRMSEFNELRAIRPATVKSSYTLVAAWWGHPDKKKPGSFRHQASLENAS